MPMRRCCTRFVFDYDPGQTSDTRDAYWLYCWDSPNDFDFEPFYDQTQWQASLTCKEWLTDYWAIIRSVWTEEIFKAKTLNNRRCFVDGDYLSTYTEFEDQNVDNSTGQTMMKSRGFIASTLKAERRIPFIRFQWI